MLKPTHKAIQDYHEALADMTRHRVSNEMGVRSAFQGLLDSAAKQRKFRFVPEQRFEKSRIRPDGVIYDENSFPRGWWESKDEKDDLQKEIVKKFEKGYPTTNIIFEDGRRGVLYQNKSEVFTADLGKAVDVATLLNTFFAYEPPAYKDFEQAKERFKAEVPELAKGLLAKIDEGHKKNRVFRTAFEQFMELCKSSLNPNIRKEAVEEMLVQHLLTERLIRTVFDNPDFVRRNVIASEVEKVLDALFAGSESRQAYLRNLDRFYVAIEEAARSIPEFSDKQHFLNTIYERFFQGYSVKLADTHGIVYTPQPIVDFMCASVVEVLKTEFGKTLGSKDVFIIDPCTGTGNFIVNLLNRVDGKDIERVYKHQLFANEVMLLPYYIAALNIEHAYFEKTGHYEPFEGLCFVDTLDLAENRQGGLFEEKNSERVERQRKSPITVVIGNPPYNTNQLDENDNNKNRPYPVVDGRIRETYTKDSTATNRNKLGDPYIRFIRWASDRIAKDGLVAFVTNNSYLDAISLDGMRKHLQADYSVLYVVDLKGNIRRDSMKDGIPLGEPHTVFGMSAMVGIAVAILVKSSKRKSHEVHYNEVHFRSRREEKFAHLIEAKSVAGLEWQPLTPDKRNNWLVAENADEFETLVPIGSKEAKAGAVSVANVVFHEYTLGNTTNRDEQMYDFDAGTLERRVKEFIEEYNSEVDRFVRDGRPEDIDSFVRYEKVNWSRDLKLDLVRGKKVKFTKSSLRSALYRPFQFRNLYFDSILNEEVRRWPTFLPVAAAELENRIICAATISTTKPFHALVTNVIPDLHLTGDTQCFPFYVYNEDGTSRRENITDWALEEFRSKYQTSNLKPQSKKRADLKFEVSSLTKWDIFYYVYGILHHPGYREKFADNLKRELPRIPFAPDFWAFSEAGKQLADLHLNYEKLKPIWEDTVAAAREPHGSASRRAATPIKLAIDPKAKPSALYHVEKMKLSKGEGPRELVINKHISVTGIPSEVFEYRLGNRSALEWVVDQYQIKTDKRSGIESNPNREDDPEYIVRLVGQVIRVSLETVKIVNALPNDFS